MKTEGRFLFFLLCTVKEYVCKAENYDFMTCSEVGEMTCSPYV